jgi:hypothetical protein
MPINKQRRTHETEFKARQATDGEVMSGEAGIDLFLLNSSAFAKSPRRHATNARLLTLVTTQALPGASL